MASLGMKDLIVVGAGPAGLAVAIAAARAGFDYLVVEKDALVNSIYRFPRGMTFFTTAELLEIGNLPFVTPNPKPTREEALNYYRRVADTLHLEVATGERVTAVEREGDCFLVRSRPRSSNSPAAEQTRRARHVALASGYYDQPNRLGIPGEDLPHVSHYFEEAHAFHRRDVVVAGGSNSAAEAALVLFRAGARVTLVHRREALSGSVKYWVKPDIENRIKEGSIAARFESQVVEIRPHDVTVEGPKGKERLAADAVFLLTGYGPDTALLEAAGVRVNPRTRQPEHDPRTFETNVPGLFVAGALTSGTDTNHVFIENGRFHGAVVVKTILERSERRRLSGADAGPSGPSTSRAR
jgi:bacillithiol disulfide reductase